LRKIKMMMKLETTSERMKRRREQHKVDIDETLCNLQATCQHGVWLKRETAEEDKF